MGYAKQSNEHEGNDGIKFVYFGAAQHVAFFAQAHRVAEAVEWRVFDTRFQRHLRFQIGTSSTQGHVIASGRRVQDASTGPNTR
jgi:hypothetical protein